MNGRRRLDFLCAAPHMTAPLADAHGAEWAHLYPGWNAESAAADFEKHIDTLQIPTTVLAVDEESGEWIGSVSLVRDDLPGEPAEINSWLASLLVRPEWRGQGVASELVERIQEVVTCICSRPEPGISSRGTPGQPWANASAMV